MNKKIFIVIGVLLVVIVGVNHFASKSPRLNAIGASAERVQALPSSIKGSVPESGAFSLGGDTPATGASIARSSSPASVVSESIPKGENTEMPPESVTADFDTGKSYDKHLEANHSGDFPRVLIEPSAAVPVAITYPEAAAGETVVACVMDGGNLGGELAQNLVLDKQGRLQFVFNAGESLGIYRVTLRHGNSLKTLRFWAGPPLTVATTPLPKGNL